MNFKELLIIFAQSIAVSSGAYGLVYFVLSLGAAAGIQ